MSITKKRKHLSPHIDSARVCVDNIMDLSTNGVGLLFKLAHIADKNNVLINDEGHGIGSMKEAAEVLGVPNGAVFSELNSKGVIKRMKFNRHWVLVINPYILHKDASVSYEIYFAFKDSKYRYVYGDDYFEEVLV